MCISDAPVHRFLLYLFGHNHGGVVRSINSFSTRLKPNAPIFIHHYGARCVEWATHTELFFSLPFFLIFVYVFFFILAYSTTHTHNTTNACLTRSHWLHRPFVVESLLSMTPQPYKIHKIIFTQTDIIFLSFVFLSSPQ